MAVTPRDTLPVEVPYADNPFLTFDGLHQNTDIARMSAEYAFSLLPMRVPARAPLAAAGLVAMLMLQFLQAAARRARGRT